ncbi:hypothetical protein [Streptomyces sp. 6N223]|uniref:hypothetical protein n=1 Tax=Streptomyces sp. 6N223 TaxID=3457412 RepID=UPI003FD40334
MTQHHHPPTRRRFLAAGLPAALTGGSAGRSLADGEDAPAAPAADGALGASPHGGPGSFVIESFVPRSAWGGRRPRHRRPHITPRSGGVTIHYVGGERVAREDHADCAAQVRSIQDYHMDANGWSDIAYTYLVCVHGHVFEGRGPWCRTAANGTDEGNQNWYAVCGLIGGSPGAYDAVTPELLLAFRRAIAALRINGGAGEAINRHRDHKPTQCPGQLAAYVLDGSLDPGPLATDPGADGAGAAPSWPPPPTERDPGIDA